jgi:hypothetical protein
MQENMSDIREHRTSITPSGYFGSGPEHIVEIENFLTDGECEYLLGFTKNNNVWDPGQDVYNENGTIIYQHNVWKDRVATKASLEKTDPVVVTMLEGIINRLKPIIEDHFDVEVTPTGPCLVRWPVGSMQWPHADKELHEGPDAGKPGNFPWYDLGTIFYLNEDYEGGRLHFPKQEIAFKPKKKAAYFFPGDLNYIHGVDIITQGTRYTSPWFWTIDKLGRDK